MMNMQIKADQYTDSNLLSRFKILSQKLSQLADGIGIQVVPYRDESLPFFNRAPLARQAFIIQDLQNYLEICESTINEGSSLQDTPRLVWNTLKKFGLRPTSDLFEYVTHGNTIEIHNQFGVQIFRNFNFYSICSYSLEELYCFPWTELYEHDQQAQTFLVQLSQKIFTENSREIIPLGFAPHIIKEKSSPGLFHIEAKMKFVAPLFEEGTHQVVAHMTIEDTRILNPNALDEIYERLAPSARTLTLLSTSSDKEPETF